MSELKTLKDLTNWRSDWEKAMLISSVELKAEVIKWYHRSDGNKHAFIMEFFNLTENDLIKQEEVKE